MFARLVRFVIPAALSTTTPLGCAPGEVPLADDGALRNEHDLENCPESLKTAQGHDAWSVLDTGVRNRNLVFTMEALAALEASDADRDCFRWWTKLLWIAGMNGFGATVFEPMLSAGLDPNLTDIDVDPLCGGCTGIRRGMTTLHHATLENDSMPFGTGGIATAPERVAMVRVLLEKGADPNLVCAGALYSGGNQVGSAAIGGATPLMFTTGWKDHGAAVEAARLLLDAGADVNVRALSPVSSGASFDRIESGDTALSLARQHENGALVEVLQSAGAIDWDLEAEVRAGTSESSQEVAEILATSQVEHDRIWSIWFGQYPIKTPIAALLDGGVDPDARTWGGKYSPMYATVFQSAIYARRPVEELRAIVAAGANVDEAGVVGLPPLVVAIDQCEYLRQLEIVPMLLEAGANVDGRAADGDTALLRMMYVEGDLALANLLLAAGADPNAANNDGQRPLAVAVRAPKTLATIERLLEAGADLNADVQGVPLWAYVIGRNPLYVSESYVPKVGPILDRFVNHPSLVIDLAAPGVEQALGRADTNPLVKPYADVIRARAAAAPSCVHALCAQGEALDPACSPCALSICDADPFCCAQAWDNVCVSEVTTVCGASCD